MLSLDECHLQHLSGTSSFEVLLYTYIWVILPRAGSFSAMNLSLSFQLLPFSASSLQLWFLVSSCYWREWKNLLFNDFLFGGCINNASHLIFTATYWLGTHIILQGNCKSWGWSVSRVPVSEVRVHWKRATWIYWGMTKHLATGHRGLTLRAFLAISTPVTSRNFGEMSSLSVPPGVLIN